MLLLFLCILFCGIANCEHSIECGTRNGMSLVEARDGVLGRYRLEWCTTLNESMARIAQWIVSLRYYDKWVPERCVNYSYKYPRGPLHSYVSEDVTLDSNCTNTCFSTNLDLIFNDTCYTIKTYLLVNSNSDIEERFNTMDYMFYVYNNYTKDSFSNSKAVFNIFDTEDHVEVHWSLHRVPAVNYSVTLFQRRNGSLEYLDVTGNCSVSEPDLTQVRCSLWPAPAPYSLVLRHSAPWTSSGLFDKINNCFLSSKDSVWVLPTQPPTVSQPASAAPWWALGGLLVMALGGGAALLACRTLLLRKLRERVQQDWRSRRQSETAAKAAGGGGGGRVLLLYARDCAPMMTVAAELRALLQLSADHVYDLYSPEVVREAARAPGEWVRRTLARADVRVVLLQSPAAAALHAPALRAAPSTGTLTLERPLLGRRAAHRAPHGSDALLPLALRLLADSAHAAHSYKKYYIATIAGLEAELVREVTPQRRYSLPAAAPLLLRDLAGLSAAAAAATEGDQHALQLQRLTEAVRALHEHVRAHPDYLNDELIFFDYD